MPQPQWYVFRGRSEIAASNSYCTGIDGTRSRVQLGSAGWSGMQIAWCVMVCVLAPAQRWARPARCARLAALGAGREAGSPRSVSRSSRGRSWGGHPNGNRIRIGTHERLAAHPARTDARWASVPALGDPPPAPYLWCRHGEGSGRELRRCTVPLMAPTEAAPLSCPLRGHPQSSPGLRRRGRGARRLRARGTSARARGREGRGGAREPRGTKAHEGRKGACGGGVDASR
jgi:hypothetical protein